MLDIDQIGHGLGKADWSLDSVPAAVAAFRSAVITLSTESARGRAVVRRPA